MRDETEKPLKDELAEAIEFLQEQASAGIGEDVAREYAQILERNHKPLLRAEAYYQALLRDSRNIEDLWPDETERARIERTFQKSIAEAKARVESLTEQYLKDLQDFRNRHPQPTCS